MNTKYLGRTTAAIIGATALALATPLAANAHVTIDPGAATPGSYTVITVKVPNESATAATNRVELSIPSDTPFASVRYVPVPGWSAELVFEEFAEPVVVGEREISRAVTTVTWTAEPGSEIQEGELQLFPLSVGPVPDTGSIVLAADQFYTDGEVVSWSEEGDDAERPAPILYVGDAPAGDHGHATPTVQADSPAPAQEEDVLARVLAVAGLMVGTAGLVFGLMNRNKRRD